MDWNSNNNNNNNNNNSSSSSSKLMLTMRNDSGFFYPRSTSIPDHHTSTGSALLYGSFEGGSSDQESADVEVSDQELGLHPAEKKRRLSVDQVRSLELNFEMENKLEPERKKQLAHELGLQPRQVAVWFQNRRARWKTKQLERDYEALRASYESLVVENKKLQAEVSSLVAKLEGKVKEDVSVEQKFDVMDELCEEDADAVTKMAAGKKLAVLEEMDVVSKAVVTKEGSPCSDGYTSEILDSDYQVESVPIAEENVLPFEQDQHQQQHQQQLIAAASNILKDEPDGMVYDPHSNQLVLYKFEDAGLIYNHDFDTSSSSSSFYYAPDGIAPWWT